MSRRTQNGTETMRVSSRVVYHMPWGTLDAVVVEDRGNVGWRGRRIMRIRPITEYDYDSDPFDVPAADLTLAD